MPVDTDNTKKQTILIVHNYYQIPGGEDTVVANEKKLLEDHGHKVVLYSRNNSELKSFSRFQKLLLPITTIFNPKTYKDVKRIIDKEKIDIVHVHNTLNLISPSVYYAARSKKIPVVQTMHNFRLLCPGATFYRDGHICEDCVSRGLKCAIKHNCYRGSKLQTLACVLSTKIHRMTRIYGKICYICLTEFNKEKLLQLKQIKVDKVFVKPNFIQNNSMFSTSAIRKDQYIYVGRLDKLKGIDILFEAWKQLGVNAPKLLVCGSGPMEDWCKKFVSENKDCNIELLGFVSHGESIELIADSQALILPTQWYEGLPMTIVESFSVGTPVICSDLGNAGSLIEDGINGIKFKFDSAPALVQSIEEFRKMDMDSLEVNSYRKFMNSFSPITNYKMLTNIYSLISSRSIGVV